MRRLLTALFVLVPVLAFAQVADSPHFCDAPAKVMGTLIAGDSMVISVCHDGKDINGSDVKPSIFVLYDNGVRSTPPFTAVGEPSKVTGKTEYQLTAGVPRTGGFHMFQVAFFNEVGETELSEPFVLRVVVPAAVLTKPLNLNIAPTPAPAPKQ